MSGEQERGRVDRSAAWYWYLAGFNASAEGFNGELLNDPEGNELLRKYFKEEYDNAE